MGGPRPAHRKGRRGPHGGAPVYLCNTEVSLSPQSQEDPLKIAKQVSNRSFRERTLLGRDAWRKQSWRTEGTSREQVQTEETVTAAADGNAEGCFGVRLQGTATWDLGLRGLVDPQSVLQVTPQGHQRANSDDKVPKFLVRPRPVVADCVSSQAHCRGSGLCPTTRWLSHGGSSRDLCTH